jgi:type I restriction enzyme S subunit
VFSGQTENDGVLGCIESFDYEFVDQILFVTTVGAKAMSLRIISGRFSLSQNCALIIPRDADATSASYYFYFLQQLFAYEKSAISLIMQPSLRFEDLNQYSVFCLSFSEQTTIANYLDRKTAEIDRLIANKERLIELYEEEKTAVINQAVTRGLNPDAPMKSSGIDGLGDIPEHWEVKKLKYLVCKIGSGVTPKGGASTYQLSGIPLLRSQNVHFDGLRLDDVAYISEEIHENMSGSKVQPGDVLLNITGASIGRCYFVDEILGEANVNQHVCIIRPAKGIGTKFLYLVLRSSVGQTQISLEQTGGGREGLNFEALGSFEIPIMKDENEQTAIVQYLETQCSRLDTIIDKFKKQIDLLKEYRATLISEVVTGKIDVRDEVVQ